MNVTEQAVMSELDSTLQYARSLGFPDKIAQDKKDDWCFENRVGLRNNIYEIEQAEIIESITG